MPQQITIALSAEEQKYLLGVARLAVAKGLSGRFSDADIPPPPDGVLHEGYGAFVTLKKRDALRGCVGLIAGDAPLYLTVARMAQAAATSDPRFPPVSLHEEANLHYEVTILGPLSPCREPEKIVIGRHGLLMRQNRATGMRQGLLLPQVPVEWGWNRETFLRQTCIKANVSPDEWENAWKEGSNSELYWFEAVIYHD